MCHGFRQPSESHFLTTTESSIIFQVDMAILNRKLWNLAGAQNLISNCNQVKLVQIGSSKWAWVSVPTLIVYLLPCGQSASTLQCSTIHRVLMQEYSGPINWRHNSSDWQSKESNYGRHFIIKRVWLYWHDPHFPQCNIVFYKNYFLKTFRLWTLINRKIVSFKPNLIALNMIPKSVKYCMNEPLYKACQTGGPQWPFKF